MTTILWLLAAGMLALALGVGNNFASTGNSAPQIIREGSFELNTTPEKALPLFTPEGERAWVDGWNPKPIYPAQGNVAFQTNAVFRVDHNGEKSLWTILEANPIDHVAEYVYTVEGERLSRVRVKIEPLAGGRCKVHVRYVHTALSEKGLDFIATVTEEAYAQKMRDWQRMTSADSRP